MTLMSVNAKNLLDSTFKKARKKSKIKAFKPMKVPKFSVAGATRCSKG